MADKYDFMNTLLSFGIHLHWKRIAVENLDLNTGDIVLDLCGGTGDLSVLAEKKIGMSGRVTLYDINQKMIKKGKSRVLLKTKVGGKRIVQVPYGEPIPRVC